jgi:hypothetical protein
MTQFHKNNIDEEWMDLVNDYPHIFLEPSPEVLEMFNEYSDREFKDFPDTLQECCNLRYGFECPIEWKGIIREFCEEMDLLMKTAKENGDDFKYCTFILKQKFGTCRDQGSSFGVDASKYYPQWRDAAGRLYNKSLNIVK